jgi:hypothetical protein
MWNLFKLRRRGYVDTETFNMAWFDRLRGGIIALWAAIESSIDQANHYGWLYSNKSVSKVVPQGLRWKIQTFKKVNRDLLPFEPLRERAAELLDWVERRYEDRHWMAHGYFTAWAPDGEGVQLVKHEFLSDGTIKDSDRTFAFDDLSAIYYDLLELGGSFASYNQALAEQIQNHPFYDQRS